MARLPSLVALRAFEAAGRHLSFKNSAIELGVTPAAVSHQIKFLEEDLGTRLFERRNRSLALTRSGSRLWTGVREGFERLRVAIEDIRANPAADCLTIGVGPAIASKWLIPRLRHFTALHPDIDVRVLSLFSWHHPPLDQSDVTIIFSERGVEGASSDRLFGEYVTPLCSPRLLTCGPLRDPRDIASYALLHDDSMSHAIDQAPSWTDWLRAAGADGVDGTRGSHFTHSDHAIAAAIDGAGILLGRFSLACEDIERGLLIQPFRLELPVSSSFFLVSSHQRRDDPKIAAFRVWLLERAAEHPAVGIGRDHARPQGS